MEKNQTLTNEHYVLKEKFDKLCTQNDLLSVDYEKLTYEFLQRKISLGKLKKAREELEKENNSLKAQTVAGVKIDLFPTMLNFY